MAGWTEGELDTIARTDELEIAPRREDGGRHGPTPIWVVRDGDDLYVRAYRGRAGSWFRAAVTVGQGHIRYDRAYVEPMLTGTAREAMLRLVPR
ncbi:MAG: DUF2255 family protein [Streptosporangiales bacterium]|nr:DUF2255 family protein [Streptosporangiales bacterium]